MAIIRNQNIYTQKYLFGYINNNKNLFVGNKGTTFEAISTANLRVIKIPLPPLEIQKKIVLKIEKLENEIKKSKEIIDNSKSEKEEILKKYL